MNKQIIEALDRTVDTNNYLKKAEANSLDYLSNFEKVHELYLNHFPSEVVLWLRDKMLLNTHPFDEKQFIQFASEATIVEFFTKRYPSHAEIEKKINPNNQKDVDLVFSHKDFTFNIEVKCSDFVEKERIQANDSLKVQTIGRLPGLKETMADLNPILEEVAKKLNLDGGVEMARNMDNNLKDFLKSADEKFNPNSTDKELNILAVSCDDSEDMQLWYYYMFKDAGLFTSESFYPKSNFENVDLVLLNNLYFKHNDYESKNISNPWEFENTFNLMFKNPNAKQPKEEAIQEFLKICPNYNTQFKDWDISGVADEEVKDSRRIADFIKAELEEKLKIYHYERP